MATANSFNVNIDGVDRPMTQDEKTAFLKWQKEKLAIIESNKQEAIDKQTAKQAVLNKLGLTADEAAALLGQFGNTYRVDRLRNNTRQHNNG